jgi:hypothetical protein
MAAKKKNTDQIISLDAFGSAKDYWLCWVKSPLPHFSFAANVQKHFGFPCSYIGSILLDDVHEDLAFPMYYMSFSEEFDINLVILSNHVTAPTSVSMGDQNPLLGGLLFEDEYYLFNKQGLTKIQFSYPMADYVLLLSTDKQVDIEDYAKLLPSIPNIQTVCQDTPQNIAQSQKKSKSVLDFLQYLFYESEAYIKDLRRRKLFKKLHNKMSVAESNYIKLRFPVEDNRVIVSDLLRREDY